LWACQPETKPVLVGAAHTASETPVATASGIAHLSADAPGFYMGRQIAPTMSHEGADWLVRPEREAEESSARMLKELGLAPGMTACDFGAGNGFHTLVMAKSVAPGGRAVAIDIQPEMLTLLQGRAKAAAVTNVDTILATATDPKLGAARCDLILLADVYHELDDPAGTLAHLRRALRPKGLLALLEFRTEDPKVPIKPEHKMSRAQISKELEANGFALARSFDELPWQHLMFFAVR
jgi:SAM-dependent methyltransferase